MKERNRMLLPIPSDWDGERWDYAIVCYPKSTQWQSIIYGKMAELTRGRKWDGNTGTITEAQAIGLQILEHTSMACGDDIKRIADNLEMLVKLDDTTTVTRSITEVLAGGAGGADFDELIDAIQNEGSGVGTSDLKDWLEMMTYVKELLPNFHGPSLFGLLKSLMEMRFKHNLMGQLQLINANLRYAGLALAPQKAGQTADDEESFIQELYTGMDIVPWMLTGVAALAEPTPVGETLMAGAIAKTVGKAIVQKLIDYIWSLFQDDAEAIPEGSIVGMLEKIANAAGGGQNTSQALTIQQIIQNISTVVSDNDVVDFPDIYASLTQIFDFLPDEFQDSYRVPDPAGLVQAAILDRSMNDLREELAAISAKIAPDAANNLAASVQNLNLAGIIAELNTIATADNSIDLSGIIQQLTIMSNRIAPADQNVKSAIEALNLSVVNDVTVQAGAAPAVTVNNDVPTPSVTVNVDPTPLTIEPSPVPITVSTDLATIESQLGSLASSLSSIAVNGNNNMIASTAELANIATRINDLQCICENLAELVDTAQAQTAIVVPIYSATPDAYKCDASKWLLGKVYVDARYYNDYYNLVADSVLDSIGEALDWIDVAPMVGQVGGVAQVVIDILQNVTGTDMDYILTMFLTNRPAMLCDLYEAATATEARQAISDRLDTIIAQGLPGGIVAGPIKTFVLGYLFDTTAANRLFLPEGHELRVSVEEIEVYGGWSNDDCSGCGPTFDFSCMNGSSGNVNTGYQPSGSLFIAGAWSPGADVWHTIESVPTGPVDLIIISSFDIARLVEVEVTVLSSPVTVSFEDCNNDVVHQEVINIVGTAGSYECGRVEVSSSSSFTIRIKRIGV